MTNTALGAPELKAMGKAGLVLPRGPRPGEPWTARTPAEVHLLRQGQRLDVMRRKLLGELARMQLGAKDLRAKVTTLQGELTGLRRTMRDVGADRAPEFTQRVTDVDLSVLAAAARGETRDDTARRLGLSLEAIKSRRVRATRHVGAATFYQAVAMASAAGVVPAVSAMGGGVPR